jgi:hypothetical protein
MNAGRYVGVELIDEFKSPEEFRSRIKELQSTLIQLQIQSTTLENQISSHINEMLG